MIPRRASKRIGWLGAAALWLLPGVASAQAQPSGSEVPLDGRTEESLAEVARQIQNPVSPLWQLTVDHQVVGMRGGGLDGVEPAYTGSFEPQGPVWQGRGGPGRWRWAADLGFYARLTVPFVATVPVPSGSGGSPRTSGFGDIQLGGVLGPKRLSGWVGGLGPTFIFPSASHDALGQGKWQAGPAAVLGYLGQSWTVSATAQQWWSFAGAGDRPHTSQLCVSYTLIRNLPRRWQVGMQPSLDVDWTASRGNAVSFPVGLGVGKTIRIGSFPVQFWLEADYYAVRPDDLTGPRWGIDLQIVPVVPF